MMRSAWTTAAAARVGARVLPRRASATAGGEQAAALDVSIRDADADVTVTPCRRPARDANVRIPRRGGGVERARREPVQPEPQPVHLYPQPAAGAAYTRAT